MSFIAIRENKILAKISGFTVILAAICIYQPWVHIDFNVVIFVIGDRGHQQQMFYECKQRPKTCAPACTQVALAFISNRLVRTLSVLKGGLRSNSFDKCKRALLSTLDTVCVCHVARRPVFRVCQHIRL